MELNQLYVTRLRNKRARLMVLFWKRKKAYIVGLGRDQLEHLASPMTKSETSPRPDLSTTALPACMYLHTSAHPVHADKMHELNN